MYCTLYLPSTKLKHESRCSASQCNQLMTLEGVNILHCLQKSQQHLPSKSKCCDPPCSVYPLSGTILATARVICCFAMRVQARRRQCSVGVLEGTCHGGTIHFNTKRCNTKDCLGVSFMAGINLCCISYHLRWCKHSGSCPTCLYGACRKWTTL